MVGQYCLMRSDRRSATGIKFFPIPVPHKPLIAGYCESKRRGVLESPRQKHGQSPHSVAINHHSGASPDRILCGPRCITQARRYAAAAAAAVTVAALRSHVTPAATGALAAEVPDAAARALLQAACESRRRGYCRAVPASQPAS